MQSSTSRRDFLKLTGTALASMLVPKLEPPDDLFPPISQPRLGRITLQAIKCFKHPTSAGVFKGYFYRDQVIELLEDADSMDKSLRNQRWYRVSKGYVHSAYIQPVQQIDNPIVPNLPADAVLAEITHPWVQSYRKARDGWHKLYRLYYGSLHWVTGYDNIRGTSAYRIYDNDIYTEYYVAAKAVRLLDPLEYIPFTPRIPRDKKKIVVSIKQQILTAYEGDQIVLTSPVSSGVRTRISKPGDIPTETPIGDFRIRKKCPSVHMGNGNLTSDPLAYELPGVPWVMFFDPNGVALHGCYWHDNYGVRMSHGCVNLPNDVAQWLYRWTDPVADGWMTPGEGTHIRVEV